MPDKLYCSGVKTGVVLLQFQSVNICYKSKLDFVLQFFKKYTWIKIKVVVFFFCVIFVIFFRNCLFLRLITNYDNRLLQFAIGTLLHFTTTVITIHDRYYNSRQVLLQFTKGITIHDRTAMTLRNKENHLNSTSL